MKFKSNLSTGLIAVLVVFAMFVQTACNKSDVITYLGQAISSADNLVTKLDQAHSIPAASVLMLHKYLGDLSVAFSEASTELASADDPTVKAAKIGEYFALAVVPHIPGLPPGIDIALVIVVDSVTAFLTSVHAKKPLGYRVSKADSQSLMLSAAQRKALEPTFVQRRQLAGLHSRAEKLKAKLSKVAVQ